ncbi:hypothetical protein JZO81_20235 [Enterococcus hulanensis]|uniref:hypothetical protein n=1 Tax=Enterococcus TaxID=1350 RepID=UPI000B5A8EDD|nr:MULTISPECIES: hypothetical protein [Enterococcus]MBO0413391.1 hypothetical protein [Enterococcus hulanensis]OTO21877.1 hypothetical protein A5875_003259 [Enterococcus sp. 3H8_DIV0648]
MNAQQKKNGWFFNKNIIDEINSVPEEEIMIEERPRTVEQPVKKETDETAELKRAISERDHQIEQIKRDTALEKQRLTKENEKYKQALLRTGEEKAENRRQIQDLETEVRRNRQEIQRLQDNKETGYLKEQLEQAEEEVTTLKASLEQHHSLEADLEEAKKQLHEFAVSQQDGERRYQEAIQQVEHQMDSLAADLTKKEELVAQLDQLIADKDQQILEKEELVQQLIEDQKHQEAVIESEQIASLHHQIDELKTENEQLKQEAIHSQHEIGEVLISARRQANRMVEKAKMDAQRIVKDSEAELQTIHDRAKEISCEVDESRQTIMSIYEEMKTRVDQLAQSDVPDLEEIKGRYEYPKVSVMSRKEFQ